MIYLFMYDIADPKRLRQLAKLMSSYGVRVQYSVFECKLKPSQFNKLKIKATTIMDLEADAVRIYPLQNHSWDKQELIGVGCKLSFPKMIII